MSKTNDKYLTESISLLDREFGQPLPTLQSVMKKYQENQASDWKGNDKISEGREEKAKAKTDRDWETNDTGYNKQKSRQMRKLRKMHLQALV